MIERNKKGVAKLLREMADHLDSDGYELPADAGYPKNWEHRLIVYVKPDTHPNVFVVLQGPPAPEVQP